VCKEVELIVVLLSRNVVCLLKLGRLCSVDTLKTSPKVRTVSCKTPDYSQIFLKGIIPNFAVALPDAVKYERIIELVTFCSRQSLCLSMY